MATKTTKLRRRALKALALASVSMAAMAGAQAQAQTAARPVTPRYGDISPFYGDISPFYGDISPFYGDISPFYGDISPFYGDISPFWGDINPFYGDINPFYGDINPFWGDINPFSGPVGASAGSVAPRYGDIVAFWGDISPFWGDITTFWRAGDYTVTATKLTDLVAKSDTTFGAAYTAKTGKGFADGFANPLFAKYNINLADPTSLSRLTAADQARFFLEWHDNLMQYAGVDQVDWWMGAARWTPGLTQTQGYGADTTIGLLDFTVAGDTVIQGNIIKYDGVSNFTNGHGAAVASLMVGAHDGQGVMGIAPRAKVVAYNPFDATGTAGWADIKTGLLSLAGNGASVINMSLGVPGYTLSPDWDDVLHDGKVRDALKGRLLVVAAGNEGATQTGKMEWHDDNAPLIVVGSVGLNGQISNFSNRPGDACLRECKDGKFLKDRFIVAPGELVLVSDDKGGVTRVTGTSIAAPLVSGAVALIHDRWPWLAKYPKQTSDIILKSARDLGAPGTDPIYGVGMLDITASQSPLSYGALKWYEYGSDGKLKEKTASQITQIYQSEKQLKWDAKGYFFYAFEDLGGVKRDFAIPLSSKLIGQNVTTANGGQERFQGYLLASLDAWVTGTGKFSDDGQAVANPWGAEMTLSIAPKTARYGFVSEGPAYQSTVRVAGEKSTVKFGYGSGAAVLAGQANFSPGDFDVDLGGANPFLGLASGGAFADASYRVTERLSISAGATHRDDKRDASLTPAVGHTGSGAKRYEATAQHLAAAYALTDAVTLTGGYTRLKEASALLGIQSIDPSDFAGGSTTDGFSVGVDVRLSDTLSLSASGTRGKTRPNDRGQQNLAVGADGITSTAYEVALTKTELFAGGDRARFSLSQPMFVEKGSVDFTTAMVVDRTTGEIGPVTQSFDISTKERPFAAEFLYGVPVMKGAGEVSLFGRAETTDKSSGAERLMIGGRFKVGF